MTWVFRWTIYTVGLLTWKTYVKLNIFYFYVEKDFGGNTIKVEIATRKMNNNFGGGRGGRGGGFGRGTS